MEKKQLDSITRKFTRRELIQISGLGTITGLITGACQIKLLGSEPSTVSFIDDDLQSKAQKEFKQGKLIVKYAKPTKEPLLPGLHSLDVDKAREALLYVPKEYKPEIPAPLALILHGAGGSAQRAINLLQPLADEANLILLSPKSQNQTWDMVMGKFGVDVEFINKALEYTFEHCSIDKSRIAISGFSDGASYALSLGIINGKLFNYVMAFSPGYTITTGQSGQPHFYISHGTKDQILPIDRCSRKIVTDLKDAGYSVKYKEFDGPHAIPREIAVEAVNWFVNKK